jgi:hypothetical protein
LAAKIVFGPQKPFSMNNTRPVKAVVIGSTGQVGRQLIPRLLAVYDSVVSVARRSFDFAVPDVDGMHLEDFEGKA